MEQPLVWPAASPGAEKPDELFEVSAVEKIAVGSEEDPLEEDRAELERLEREAAAGGASQEAGEADEGTESLTEELEEGTVEAEAVKDKMREEVDEILKRSIEDQVKKFTEAEQQKFDATKFEAERTRLAQFFSEKVKTGSLNHGEAWKLIHAWLLLIPGKNKYYFQKEAKLKVDALVVLQEVHRREQEASNPL